MKHLYIIGNGFDIFTGLKTRYLDFRWWLENNYPFIYENMQAAYDMDVEWWNDFEVQLGKLDVKSYISKFKPPEKTWKEIIEETRKKRLFEEKNNLPTSLHHESFYARRLRGLLDVLQYCFVKWVESCQESFENPQYIHLEKKDSFFINFNYTDVLEWLYEIPEERILHIHGRASKHERLIFGHNTFLYDGVTDDEEQTNFELNRYHKNPYEFILKYDQLTDKLNEVECVHIFGLSFSPVDEDYMDWIFKYVSSDAQWEVSWYSDTDKERIDNFVLNHWVLKDRMKLIKLEDIVL